MYSSRKVAMAREIRWKHKPLVMGVLNVTPDSFFDGGRTFSREKAVLHGLEMVKEGADIIDVGGESTRPFSEPVLLDDELERVLPVIRDMRAQSDVFISVDTCKSEVARQSIAAGADMVNDISGLTFDPEMVNVVRDQGVYAVIMHMKGTPGDMQKNPHYDDVIFEIKTFFRERVAFAEALGVAEDHIILDPGIGFGKRATDNLRIIKELRAFKDMGRPLLIGTSMKAFIGKVTDTPLNERTEGTLASIALCAWNGADMIRVHDVRGAVRVVKLVDAVMKA
jgi:dihydropteroate synthase